MPTLTKLFHRHCLDSNIDLLTLTATTSPSAAKASLNQARRNPGVWWDSANPPRIGFVDVIRGEGMPVFGGDTYGDLYVEYKVVLPLELTPKMRQSKPLLPSMSRGFLSLFVSELDRAFNGDYSGGNDRDEL